MDSQYIPEEENKKPVDRTHTDNSQSSLNYWGLYGKVCPSCGHCPTCGTRTAHPVQWAPSYDVTPGTYWLY